MKKPDRSMTKNRLSKILSNAGVASRRKCEEMIFKGLVSVNGTVILKPQHLVDPNTDKISVNDEKVRLEEPKVYYILNKPRGYVCSHNDKAHKNKAIDLLPKKYRLFTVGRLDKDTTGLIIVTNDGQLSHRIIHPSFEVQKEYLVKTNFEVSPEELSTISSGVNIDGEHIVPLKVTKVRKNTLKITVKEGKKHEVRKLVMQSGLEVKELARIRIGNLHLGNLALGEHKKVSLKELEEIFS
jgi:23S rRNA pseudouridine2605 synthase